MKPRTISPKLLEQLNKVTPSIEGAMRYHPCRVTLVDGRSVDRVYVVEAESYIRDWGVWPKEDSAKRFILIEDVASIEDSPTRLPAHLANKMYKAGESGMGYCIFTLVLSDNSRLAQVTGNAV